MKSTLNFHLPRINRKATRKAVEDKLSELQYVLLKTNAAHQPKITATLELLPTMPDGQFHSSTEDAAIKNAEEDQEKKRFIDMMMESINRLPELERGVIVKEYLDNSYTYNYEIFDDLGISKAQYYKLKGRAFYNIALMIGVEVYIYDEKVKKP